MTISEDLWQRPDADYPTGGSLEEQIRFLIGYATLAPSGHNTQPWLFGTGPDWADVLADRTRALSVVDPHDRELTISCGAAIGIFEVAARRFSLQTTVAISPDEGCQDHLAQITVAKGSPPDDMDLALFNAIKNRRTDRRAYFMELLPSDLSAACRDIVQSVGASVRFLTMAVQSKRLHIWSLKVTVFNSMIQTSDANLRLGCIRSGLEVATACLEQGSVCRIFLDPQRVW